MSNRRLVESLQHSTEQVKTQTMQENHPINSTNWWHIYGEAKTAVKDITVDQVADLYINGISGVDFVVVDVRRADLSEMIPGAINLPAQSLPAALPSLVHSLSNIEKFIFHCNSSKGRGPRAAGWFANTLDSHLRSIDPSLSIENRVFVLKGGINAWKDRFGAGSIEDRGRLWDRKTMSTLQL
ncbi:hypothetical protein WALSEDRAFT_32465 [Wallemia mellicola CBS 633.66]|uniref:Rhodanese domain-containing protein n=1 Tax=Wallemia mellicola (strain ATCC MYA-4683 / CBS 633.66) TaxID=671144 RepID=I4YD94_WALMC|nr:hypothetical protein WALSEDRAFT_32465 [Wallemia mellicola CBS 633.66]EIM21936.1 hypothetical protein WALSEDRAFT_32465 [Wallemia mellicola CBS 633.66]|eukprot:XP_006958227.1 hypothetical protein WALSEDRAFT_32465 [Wallemia mellicola CBS 633.66]